MGGKERLVESSVPDTVWQMCACAAERRLRAPLPEFAGERGELADPLADARGERRLGGVVAKLRAVDVEADGTECRCSQMLVRLAPSGHRRHALRASGGRPGWSVSKLAHSERLCGGRCYAPPEGEDHKEQPPHLLQARCFHWCPFAHEREPRCDVTGLH